MCWRANFSRSPWPARSALVRSSANSDHAVAVRPSFSWHMARRASVPLPGSRRWLSASLGHAAAKSPASISLLPFAGKRASAAAPASSEARGFRSGADQNDEGEKGAPGSCVECKPSLPRIHHVSRTPPLPGCLCVESIGAFLSGGGRRACRWRRRRRRRDERQLRVWVDAAPRRRGGRRLGRARRSRVRNGHGVVGEGARPVLGGLDDQGRRHDDQRHAADDEVLASRAAAHGGR